VDLRNGCQNWRRDYGIHPLAADLAAINGAPHKTNINTNIWSSQAIFAALQHIEFLAPQQSKNAMIIKHLLIAARKIHCIAIAFHRQFCRDAARRFSREFTRFICRRTN
jgi:hypothetical protein